MSIRIYGATSGYVDLDAPAVAGSASVTLPGSGTLALYSQLKVLQVVSASYSTQTTVASTTYTDTGLSASITPSSATSKVLVFASQQAYISRSTTNAGLGLQIVRGSTAIYTPDPGANPYHSGYIQATGATAVILIFRPTILYLDSPSTTSATTYKIQGAANNTANSGQVIFQDNSSTSYMILMEIAA